MTDVTNDYPSTGDLPRIAGGQDAVLAILENGLKRYKRGGTNDSYLSKGGVVCAVGSVVAAAGLTLKKYDELGEKEAIVFDPAFRGGTDGIVSVLKAAQLEDTAIKAAKKAIKLLNNSALRLYPELTANMPLDYLGQPKWHGPLEVLNQQATIPYKPAVIACYKDAIERQKKRNRKKLAAK